MKKILKGNVAAGILGLLIASLVYQPFAVYANNSSRVDNKEIAKVLKNKSLLQSELRRLGDYYEKREFEEGISSEQIKEEIVKNFEAVVEEQKKQIDSRTSLNTEEKEARKAIYDARLAVDKKEIMNDADFNARNYFYTLADRLGARDINGIPFESSDNGWESTVDMFLLLIGVGIIFAVVGLLVWAAGNSNHNRHCHRHWVPEYYDSMGHWHAGYWHYDCDH
ncbi:MAG: hypothetical protein AAB309_07590 [Deltaproteobacteria bacterium]